MTNEAKLTTGAYYLKRGDTFDPEDWRMTHRLDVASGILRDLGYTLVATHRTDDEYFPGVKGGLGRWTMRDMTPEEQTAGKAADPEHRFRCGSGIGCSYEWQGEPEPTTEIFNAAFALGNSIQNARHAATTQMLNQRWRENHGAGA